MDLNPEVQFYWDSSQSRGQDQRRSQGSHQASGQEQGDRLDHHIRHSGAYGTHAP